MQSLSARSLVDRLRGRIAGFSEQSAISSEQRTTVLERRESIPARSVRAPADDITGAIAPVVVELPEDLVLGQRLCVVFRIMKVEKTEHG